MAVYTHISEADLKQFLTQYDLPQLASFTGIKAGVQNSNYVLVLGDTRYILTLYEGGENGVDPADLPYFLKLKQYLAARQIACPVPVAQRDGALYSTLAGRPTALVQFLAGRSSKSPTPTHCHALGQAMGKLHLAGRDFGRDFGPDFGMTRPNRQGMAHWQKLFSACRARADEVLPDMEKIIADTLAHLQENWPSDLPQGVIHADLFPDNVFFEKTELSGLIDFYFACTDFFAYDVAITLNAWCFEPDINFNITKARALLAGYQQSRKMTPEETHALPILASGAAVRFLLTRLYDYLHPKNAGLLEPKNPIDYLRRLRFHKSVTHARDYGLES